MRLKDIVKAVPVDITTGYIALKNGHTIRFNDITEVSAQYAMDFVDTFDIRVINGEGQRSLIVRLAHN